MLPLYIRARFLPPSSASLRAYATLRESVRQIDPRELYEPPVVDKRKYPEIELVNVRLQGYDFTPLEKFQSYVHTISKRFGFTVTNRFFFCSNYFERAGNFQLCRRRSIRTRCYVQNWLDDRR